MSRRPRGSYIARYRRSTPRGRARVRRKTMTMLVQHHHPAPLPTSPSPPPEYSYNAHISSPSAVQINLNLSKLQTHPPDPPKAEQSPFTIRPATAKDAAAIAHLGSAVFSATFGFSIPCNDLKAFLNEAYTVEAIGEDIRCPAKHIMVACARSQSKSESKTTTVET